MTDWPVKTLGEVCDLVGGGTPSKDHLEFYGGEIPWATVRDLNVEVLRTTEHSITAEAVKSSSSNIIPAGSVVIATRVGLGKVVKIAQDTAINQDLRGLVVKKPKELIADYLYWWYLGTVHLVVAAGTGATVQGVKLPFVSGLAIPVPPLDEQKRLVALLDAATARVTELTACYEQARTHANNLFTSALRDALESNPDWPVKTLGEICELQRGHDLPTPERREGEVPILGSTGVTGFHSVARYEGPGVAIGRSGFIGGAQYCDVSYWPLNTCLFVKNFFGNEPRWVYYILKNIDFSQYNSGTTQPSLNRNNLSHIPVSTPSLGAQQEIVAQLELMVAKTSEMVAAYDAKLQAAKDLRQSILEAAFAGDL